MSRPCKVTADGDAWVFHLTAGCESVAVQRDRVCSRFSGAGDDKQLRFLLIWIEAVLLNPVGD